MNSEARREHERKALQAEVKMSDGHGGTLRDMSVSGAAIDMKGGANVPLSTRVSLEIEGVGLIEGSVVRHTETGIAVHFDNEARVP